MRLRMTALATERFFHGKFRWFPLEPNQIAMPGSFVQRLEVERSNGFTAFRPCSSTIRTAHVHPTLALFEN